jgi:hypothetical protein
MKHLLWFLMLCCTIYCYTSCDKFDSQLKGKVSYISIIDSLEYPADSAILVKYSLNGDKEEKVSTVQADSNGLFVFDFVTLGDWKIKAQYTKDSFVYSGFSDKIHTSGEDVKTVNIVMDSVRKVTNQ